MIAIETARRDVRRQSGSEVIYQILREDIISGTLAPSERLPEVELAATLGVSRTPVREALRLLLGEQLVERRSDGGFRVATLDISQIRGVYDVRALLEGLHARDACRRLTPADFATLRQLIDRMSLLRDHYAEVVRIGTDFHGLIEQVADNRWCSQMLQQIRGHIDRYRRLSTREAGRSEAAVAEHEAIYEALLSGDAERAESAMRAHVIRGADWAVRALASVPDRNEDAALETGTE